MTLLLLQLPAVVVGSSLTRGLGKTFVIFVYEFAPPCDNYTVTVSVGGLLLWPNFALAHGGGKICHRQSVAASAASQKQMFLFFCFLNRDR